MFIEIQDKAGKDLLLNSNCIKSISFERPSFAVAMAKGGLSLDQASVVVSMKSKDTYRGVCYIRDVYRIKYMLTNNPVYKKVAETGDFGADTDYFDDDTGDFIDESAEWDSWRSDENDNEEWEEETNDLPASEESDSKE